MTRAKEKVQMISPSLNSKTEHPYLKLYSKMRRFHLNFNNLTENSSCLHVFNTEELMKPDRLVQVTGKIWL